LSSKSTRAGRTSRKTENGLITARPCVKVSGTSSGLQPLRLAEKRDGLLYVPERLGARKCPLVLMLHGAGANAHDAIQPFRRLADLHGIVLLAPDARKGEWDLLDKGFGPDVDFIDHALAKAFQLCPIDPRRVGIGGFSDGASYALSLGLRNADVFTHVIAFSPGFMAIPPASGRPGVFVSHGRDDQILPVKRCSHRIVAHLKRNGYPLTFREFPGGHFVPPEVAADAAAWFLNETDLGSSTGERLL
jgi:phospholipase/carboxylesterase